jgi:hypothetical protein
VGGREIAERFEAANTEAIDYVLGPAPSCWQRYTESEGWPVGVTARHIALGHELMVSWAEAIKAHAPIPVGDIDATNAEQAALGIVATPDQVAQALRHGGARVGAALRALDDDDLAGVADFGGQLLPAAGLAEAAVRHVHVHLASIKAATEAN